MGQGASPQRLQQTAKDRGNPLQCYLQAHWYSRLDRASAVAPAHDGQQPTVLHTFFPKFLVLAHGTGLGQLSHHCLSPSQTCRLGMVQRKAHSSSGRPNVEFESMSFQRQISWKIHSHHAVHPSNILIFIQCLHLRPQSDLSKVERDPCTDRRGRTSAIIFTAHIAVFVIYTESSMRACR